MNEQNNVPTAHSRYYYRRNSSPIIPTMVVLVTSWEGSLLYWTAGNEGPKPVQDDGLWAGPVPMPGEPHPDSVRLDALEAMANDAGGILLHDGSETGRRGLGLFTRGRRRRTLREAVDEAPR